MPAPRLLPDTETLKRLRREGWTYQNIADEYGVSRGAVYLQLQSVGATKQRPSYRHLLPWTVAKPHVFAHPAMMLRLLGRREAGAEISPPKARMLDKWLREMREADVVVCYHRDMAPNPASPTTGGFYYSRRRPEDGDSVIRMTDQDSPPPAYRTAS